MCLETWLELQQCVLYQEGPWGQHDLGASLAEYVISGLLDLELNH